MASFNACTLPGRTLSTFGRILALMNWIVSSRSAFSASVLSPAFSACIASLRSSNALMSAVAEALSGSVSNALALAIRSFSSSFCNASALSTTFCNASMAASLALSCKASISARNAAAASSVSAFVACSSAAVSFA